MGGKRVLTTLAALGVLLSAALAEARPRNYRIVGQHELSGGIGFAADLSHYTPGGFKWFNEYGYHFGGITWLNLQFNVTAGGGPGHCYYDKDGKWRCDGRWRNFGGTGLEMVGGVKLKWRLARVPLQFHAKFGGGLEMMWFDAFYGVAVAFRGGGGLRYFVLPQLGVGGELVTAFGPSFLKYGVGTDFFGTIDLNLGVEWRF